MRPQVPLLTREEAAERLNVSVSTLRRLGRSGAVNEIRVSDRLIRVDPQSVDSYIASRRTRASSASLGEAAA